MEVVFTNGIFQCHCTYNERAIPSEAGFRWNNETRKWYTPDYGVAARLSIYLDESAKKAIAKTRLQIVPWESALAIPQSEKLLPFQETSALFALSRNRSYLALDPGLGKTPIAAVITNTLFEKYGPFPVIYICPPFLTRNTEAEFRRFAPNVPVGRYGTHPPQWATIVPDSIVSRPEVQNDIRNHVDVPQSSLLFVDEAHRFKNDEAGRTQALFGNRSQEGITSFFTKVVYLSGTPMPNRPIELFPVLSNAAPQTIEFMNKFQYATKYCAAFKNQWGWDFSGASNIKELVSRVIGTFMIRYRKADVLKDLPPKTEEMVILNETLPPKLTKLSKAILDNLSPEDLMSGRIQADLGKDTLHLSTYRRELGVIKAKAAAEFIKFLLDETDESILVFAIHKEVIAILTKELEKHSPLVIVGETRMELRHEYVKEFQTNPRRRLFIGNIQAAGTGLTLTKATRVVFAEFSWVPADNDQASDRAHRIGQTDNVFVQYLVYENSVDKVVIETVLRKKKITEQL